MTQRYLDFDLDVIQDELIKAAPMWDEVSLLLERLQDVYEHVHVGVRTLVFVYERTATENCRSLLQELT